MEISENLFRGYKKGILGKKSMDRDIERKIENFPHGFLPRNEGVIRLFSEIFVVILT